MHVNTSWNEIEADHFAGVESARFTVGFESDAPVVAKKWY